MTDPDILGLLGTRIRQLREEREWSQEEQQPFLETQMGAAFLGDSSELLAAIPDESVDLIITSPPYALHFKKEYGNVDQDRYVNWLLSFAPDVRRILKPSGSFVLNIGGSWTPGKPDQVVVSL